MTNLWIIGTSQSGKTARLVGEFRQWVRQKLVQTNSQKQRSHPQDKLASAILVFAANNNNRRKLGDRLSLAVEGTYPVTCKTPVGFITDEVILFWPILFEQLKLKAQFPLRLRPETEQELATKLWRESADWESLTSGVGEYRFVRQTLDLLQLAGASGTPWEDIPTILEQGLPNLEDLDSSGTEAQIEKRRGELLLLWQKWCLERGLLSYGLIYELYWRYLLPNPVYQHHLARRYQAVFADDVDDYPAIARDLVEFLLDCNAYGVFTYNPEGKVRLGLNADPDYLEGLASRCQVEELPPTKNTLGWVADTAIELVTETSVMATVPESIQSIQTISRAELLRKTAEAIASGIKSKEVKPEEIAIIAPGLDEIARYTLLEILSAQNIAIEPLNEQRPLISSPLVRALLTLLALVYSGLGRLVDRDSIAEMLTVLSCQNIEGKLVPQIDPVRAGLLADHCYQVGLNEQPELLSVNSFARWDRLGHQATVAYEAIASWIAKNRQERQLDSVTFILNQAIEHFLGSDRLSYERLAALRELSETAQHFWEVDRRLRQNEPSLQTQSATVGQFIQLLRRGTITANPRPLRYFPSQQGAVTLATIFQYRSWRSTHRWQFWLDSSSVLWEKGGAATLFAAPLFLKSWSGRTWMPEDEREQDQQRIERILKDLLARAQEKVFLCHSDLGVNGTEQMGSLLALVHASRQLNLSQPLQVVE